MTTRPSPLGRRPRPRLYALPGGGAMNWSPVKALACWADGGRGHGSGATCIDHGYQRRNAQPGTPHVGPRRLPLRETQSAQAATLCRVLLSPGQGLRFVEAWARSAGSVRTTARITLLVTETRLERVQEISLHDAAWEGMSSVMEQRTWWYNGVSEHRTDGGPKRFPTSYAAYRALWNHLHGPGAWEANHEVVALTFEVRQQNIDTLEAAA